MLKAVTQHMKTEIDLIKSRMEDMFKKFSDSRHENIHLK
jgi:hypothetical protein